MNITLKASYLKLILPLVIIGLFLSFITCESEPKPPMQLVGPVFGTSYQIQYFSEEEDVYTKQIDSLFEIVNTSMSTYIPNSIISKLNKGNSVVLDEHFKRVFNASKRVYRSTEGAFDPTIGAVVNAWDFGPEGGIADIDSTAINSIMNTVGFNRMGIRGDTLINKSGAYLDFNAIAKGYAVDLVAEFLESKNVFNYLVEIGGELRASGVHLAKEQPWRVGLDTPRFDGKQSVFKAFDFDAEAMATSGTYRKFKVDADGNRYTHIIDTETGYPSQSPILSVSVIAEECMIADAYATAFQTMKTEDIRQFLERHPELKVFLIVANENNEFETLNFNNFPE